MSQSKIDRRTLIALAGSASLAGALARATSARTWIEQPPIVEIPSPSTVVPPSTLQLEPNLQKEILAKLRSGNVRLARVAEGVKIEDLIRFIEMGGARESPQLPDSSTSSLETIVRPIARPVLFVQNGSFQTAALQLESVRQQLERHRLQLERAIPSIGRINLAYHPNYSWIGTGWLVDQDIVVTNRHVAEIFSRRVDGGFQFRSGVGRVPIQASIDFVRENVPLPDQDREFRILKVLHVEPETGYDLALLKVAKTSDLGKKLAQPIELFNGVPQNGRSVAVIGYPAYDSRIPEPELMQKIYDGIYDVKRLAPGVVMSAGPDEVQHDCSTLGGNSGSAVIDMETGKAISLHWGGTFRTANYSVPAGIIASRLSQHRS